MLLSGHPASLAAVIIDGDEGMAIEVDAWVTGPRVTVPLSECLGDCPLSGCEVGVPFTSVCEVGGVRGGCPLLPPLSDCPLLRWESPSASEG